MNLYEFEGKNIFAKYGIRIPRSVLIRRGDDVTRAYTALGIWKVVLKAQILSGKRGKNQGILFCSSPEETEKVCKDIFSQDLLGQHVTAILLEEQIEIAEEHYLSITYDTREKLPALMYSEAGGVDVEDVSREKIQRFFLNPRDERCSYDIPFAQALWNCFRQEDARIVEINPLVKTADGEWIALDAKVALDDDGFFRHEEWKEFEPRTVMGRLPTEREVFVRKIDEGEAYYRGTAGKYIEMEGDVAVLFSGGGASIANMDALLQAGLKPANYTEYSGNPPREKVRQLAKIVLSKPGLRGLWIVGGVANFTDIAETFHGIVDVLQEIKPKYPIIVRRAGPNEKEGMRLMRECAEQNGLNMKLFGKEVSMGETAQVLAELVRNS